MLKNPRVIGVKNSSMPVQDIQMWKDEGAIVFNGPDEQLLSGLAAGAVGGIGGTYGAMPELYLKIRKLFLAGQMEQARLIQNDCCRIIYKMCSTEGNMYAVIKEILRIQGAPDIGGVRAPLLQLSQADHAIVADCAKDIADAIAKYC
jgi:N-acetylneuraminate lyase